MAIVNLNFDDRFADVIENGLKCQTIRRLQNKHIAVGDTLNLFSECGDNKSKFIKNVVCKSVENIWLIPEWKWMNIDFENQIIINDLGLSDDEIESFIKADGFKSNIDFWNYFKDKMTDKTDLDNSFYKGFLIKW